MFGGEERIPHHLDRTSPIPTDPVYQKTRTSPRPSTSGAPKRTSPIPKDPTYGEPQEYKEATPKPRVKPEAMNIARNHQGKDLAYLFNPDFKVIPIGFKQSHRDTRDHGKENHKKIKEIQRVNKQKQYEKDTCRRTPVKAVYKPDKFQHVQSKVAQQIQTPGAPRSMVRSKSLSDIKGGVEVEQSVAIVTTNPKASSNPLSPSFKLKDPPVRTDVTATQVVKRPSSGSRPPRPSSACEVDKKEKPTRPLSHIAMNKQAVQKTKLRNNPSQAALQDLQSKKENDIKQHKKGNIPKYLRTRQNEWKKAEEERIASLPDPTVPQGHSVMTEEERTKTLGLLLKSQQDMLDELKKLPMSRDTMRVQNRRDALERKLTEVDTALKIFSRPRVFIKDE